MMCIRLSVRNEPVTSGDRRPRPSCISPRQKRTGHRYRFYKTISLLSTLNCPLQVYIAAVNMICDVIGNDGVRLGLIRDARLSAAVNSRRSPRPACLDVAPLSDVLLDRLRAGVKVNLIYDSFGSKDTPGAFFNGLGQAGAKVVRFNPVNPLSSGALSIRVGWSPNDRDHRKLTVVDGRIGFAGGVNLDKAYENPESAAPPRCTATRCTLIGATRQYGSKARRWLNCKSCFCHIAGPAGAICRSGGLLPVLAAPRRSDDPHHLQFSQHSPAAVLRVPADRDAQRPPARLAVRRLFRAIAPGA